MRKAEKRTFFSTALVLTYGLMIVSRDAVLAAEVANASVTTEVETFEHVSSGRTERSYDTNLVESELQRPKSDANDSLHRPYFDENIKRNVTSPLSKTAFLHCRIRQLGGHADNSFQVSWVRQRDLHILTVGRYTYTTDQRFTSIHKEDSDDWTLQIKDSKKSDSGIFECQVNTEPKMSLPIELHIVAVEAHIPEGPVLYIKSGSPINLTCTVKDQVGPSLYVFWYHNGQSINFESSRPKVTTVLSPHTVSRLYIEASQPSDSGNYSCHPSYAEPANITLHVLDGEKPAAMQHGRQNSAVVANKPTFLMIAASTLFPAVFLKKKM